MASSSSNTNTNNNNTPSSSNDTNNSSSDRFGASLFGGRNGYFGEFSDAQRRYRLEQCWELRRALDQCREMEEHYARSAKEATRRSIAGGKESDGGGGGAASSSSWKKWLFYHRNDADADTFTAELEPTVKIQETRTGMKMSRFYSWGLVNPEADAAIETMRAKGGRITDLRRMHPSVSDDDNNSNTTTSKDTGGDSGGNLGEEEDVLKSKATHGEKKPIPSSSLSSFPPPSCSKEEHALWGCKAMAMGCSADLVDLRNCFRDHLNSTDPANFNYDGGGGGGGGKCRLEQGKLVGCVNVNERELMERIRQRSSE